MSTLQYFSVPSTKQGEKLNVFLCLPEGRPRAVVQMVHGMVAHIARYEELARYLAERGIASVGHDHLGHGKTAAGPEDYGYFGEPDGNRLVLDDIRAVTRWGKARAELAGAPGFLLGHSMGSFYSRQYLCEYGAELTGAILLGTGSQPRAAAALGRLVCRAIALCKGWRYRSAFVDRLAMGSYNRSFEPGRTSGDWLNRDEKEVDAHLADPRCQFIFTLNAYYSLFTCLGRQCDPKLLARVPKDLPLLFLAGGDDPVGDKGKGVRRAVRDLKKAGVKNIRTKLYPGARHELLVEVNRQEVFADILAFVDSVLDG